MNAGTKTETATKSNVQQAVPFFGVKNIAEFDPLLRRRPRLPDDQQMD